MSEIDITKAVQGAMQTTIKADELFAVMPCGHSKAASVIYVDVGERKEGETDWTVLRRELEVKCDECGSTARFYLTTA